MHVEDEITKVVRAALKASIWVMNVYIAAKLLPKTGADLTHSRFWERTGRSRKWVVADLGHYQKIVALDSRWG